MFCVHPFSVSYLFHGKQQIIIELAKVVFVDFCNMGSFLCAGKFVFFLVFLQIIEQNWRRPLFNFIYSYIELWTCSWNKCLGSFCLIFKINICTLNYLQLSFSFFVGVCFFFFSLTRVICVTTRSGTNMLWWGPTQQRRKCHLRLSNYDDDVRLPNHHGTGNQKDNDSDIRH